MENTVKYQVWCEYDLGLGRFFYDSFGAAKDAAKKAVKECGIEESFDELMSSGLLQIEEYENLKEF